MTSFALSESLSESVQHFCLKHHIAPSEFITKTLIAAMAERDKEPPAPKSGQAPKVVPK
jgi:hypothetical protein